MKNQLSKGFVCMFIFDKFELPDLTKKLLHVTISKKIGNFVDFRNCVYNIMPIMLQMPPYGRLFTLSAAYSPYAGGAPFLWR